MTEEAALLGKLFGLVRGDLENAVFPEPQVADIVARTEFVRVARLARFWDGKQVRGTGLVESATGLMTALHAMASPFVSALLGSDLGVEYWLGGASGMPASDGLGRTLRGAFPGCQTSVEPSFPSARLDSLTHAAVLTGTPTLPEEQSDQIERLVRGLYGRDWAFIVFATPLQPATVLRSINELAAEVRNAQSVFLLKHSPTDEFNRTAQRYVELLEAKLKRFELGRVQGMWQAEIALLAADAATLAIGTGLLHAAYAGERSLPDPIRCSPCSTKVHAAPATEPLTSAEVGAFARPPQEEYPGYELVEYVRYGVNTVGMDSGHGVEIGAVIDRGSPTGTKLLVRREDFTKHGLISGITGSGKTNTCMSLLRQLWDGGAGVPFLVIESAKSEYRDLRLQSGLEALKVFTVGDEATSPLRLNPFEVPEGVLVQTHIDYVKSLFLAAFVLYPPMPYVLEQSVQEIYEDRGWDVAVNVNPRGRSARAFPTLSDLAAKIAVVIERMGYDERITMDVRAGLLARIDQLRLGGSKGFMFDVRQSTPAVQLFDSPCVIELRSLVSDDEKAFLIGLLLIQLYERAEVDPARRDGGLHHVTLIEEAHRLLRATSTEQGGDVANPRGRAIETFANILAEVRAYGEGILIAEQVPSKLVADCIKNTSLKIVHRLVVEDERLLMGKAIGLDESQARALGTLPTGQAVVFTERLQKPVLLTVPQAKGDRALVSHASVAVAMREFRSASVDCPFCRRTGASCRASRAGTLASAPIVQSFRLLFNGLRFRSPTVAEQYETLRREHSATTALAGIPLLCVLGRLADQECDRRGQFHSWSFEEVDRATEALLAELERLDRDEPTTLQFQATMRRLHARDDRPYAGCRTCGSPCDYRFDAAAAGGGPAQEFRERFTKKTPQPWNTLVAACWRATEAIPTDLRQAHQGTGLCFGIQQFHALQIPAVKQERAAAKLAAYLFPR